MTRFAFQNASVGATGPSLRPKTVRRSRTLGAATALLLAACGSDTDSVANPLHGSDAGLDGSTVVYDAGIPVPGSDSGNPQNVPCSATAPSADSDGDGFTGADGDCNDCDKLINPGAFDFPGNAYDEDCSGSPAQNNETDCDMGLDIASTSAEDAARALGLCKFTTADKRDWGVIQARFTTADGSGTLANPLQVGLLPKFGVVTPLAGGSLLALSSGVARAPDQAGFTSGCDEFQPTGSTPPAGYPKESSACKVNDIFGSLFGKNDKVNDQAALELKIRVPSNASSLQFDSNFYSYEYPDYICTSYNDFYVAFQEPKVPGAADGNIVFDSNNDPIGVNTGLLAVCDKNSQPLFSEKKFECLQGTGLLKDTGYGSGEYSCGQAKPSDVGPGGAATGWLHTLAPAMPGSIITLRFAIWDTNDADFDSTVLIDKFEWSVEMPTGASTVANPVLL